MRLHLFLFFIVAFLNFGVTTSFCADHSQDSKNADTIAVYGNFVTTATVQTLIAHLNSHPKSLTVVHELRRRKNQAAIGPLRAAYANSTGKIQRKVIAAALMALGDKSAEYRTLLQRDAIESADRNIPFPIDTNNLNSTNQKTLTPSFLGWASSHKVNVDDALELALRTDPQNFLLLSLAEDPESLPIFEKGIHSQNPLIALYSAKGLARIEGTAAIPMIVEACSSQPTASANVIARTLFLFDTKDAVAAEDKFITDKKMLNAIRSYSGAKRRRISLGE